MRSRTTCRLGSDRVSPVVVALSPTRATMSPARASLTSSRVLACICRMRPIRSRLPLTVLITDGAALDHAGIDPDEAEGADERVGHDLEGERGERLGVVGAALDRLVGAGPDALDRRHVGRRRQEVDHRVQERLHALVLEGRAAQHRDQLVRKRALADAALERRRIRLLARRGSARAPRRRARPPPRSGRRDSAPPASASVRAGSSRYSNSAPSVSSFQMIARLSIRSTLPT